MWVNPKDYRVVGAVLAAARVKAGVSQSELAHRLKKPQSFVSNYERGQRRIDILELAVISSALGGQPVEIMTEAFRRLRVVRGLRRH